jgi:autotransporter-associated beta strand protein
MKPRSPFLRLFPATLTLASTILLTCAARGADVYWDIDGATAGAGGASPVGTWDTGTTANWTTDSTGSSATQVWTSGDNAIFSAGSNATGTFDVTNSGVTADNITQQEGRVRIISNTLTLADTSVIYDVQTRVSGDYDLRINSVIADSSGGASSIIKTGAGILHLGSQANTFSGGVILNQGTLAVEHAGSLGTGTVTLNSGSFVKNFASFTTANAINVTGAVKIGAIQQNSNWTLSGTWQAGSTGGNFNVSNTASDFNGFTPSTMSIIVTGDTSAYTGTISHTAGNNRLRFGTNAAGQTLGGNSISFFTSGSTTTGLPIDITDGGSGTFRMGELAGTGGRITAGFNAAATTTFQVGALNTSSKFAGALNDAGTGKAALDKVGTGNLEFSKTDGYAYTGGTTITAGSLLISNSTGSGTGTGAITVDLNGTLGGAGIIASTDANGITVNGALAPGGSVSTTTGGTFSNSAGTLTLNMANTTGTIQMNSGATFQMELGSAGASIALVGGSDMIAITGAASGDLVVNNNLINLLSTGEVGFYKLIDTSLDGSTYSGLAFDGTTGVVSGGLSTTNLTAGLNGTLIVGTASNGGEVGDLYLQVVPEPATALLGGLGALGLLRRRRTA